MSRVKVVGLVVLGLMVAWGGFAAAPRPQEGPQLSEGWKGVEEAMKQGLPKTAIERLEPIIQAALKEKKYPEAIRAVCTKIALEANIQGNKPEEKIRRLEKELQNAPKPMRDVMEAVLAHWYWHFFQQNRWRFMERTATAQPPGDDILTWDLPRIFAEIDKHFMNALVQQEILRKTPVSEYDALLVKGNVPDTYRPTMFDFIAYEALEFYTSGEQAAAKPEDAFELLADSPIFDPAEKFMEWKFQTTDADSPVVKAIMLYQALLSFHKNDKNSAAFLDADLWRLHFGYNKAVGENKNERYKAALKHYIDKNGDHEISARARFYWAQVLRDAGDLVEARKIALQGAQAFPESIGGRMCHNLVQEIEAKSLQIATERVWNQPWPTIQVRYRNLNKVYFRVVSVDWEQAIRGSKQRPEFFDDNERRALLKQKPVLEWSVNLPPTPDYQERVEELPVNSDLKPGFYVLLASDDPKFPVPVQIPMVGPQQPNHVVHGTDFWVSTLALVVRTRGGEEKIEGFVLDAQSGQPLEGAEVQVWFRPDWNQPWQPGQTGKTDANGLFSVPGVHQKQHLLFARYKDQQLSSANEYWVHIGQERHDPYKRTIFFTDRSLYRPGQTIYYKGICLRADPNQDDYSVLPNETLTVVFVDTNGKEIERRQHKTNDYGSFNGAFTAPRDRLTGHMQFRVENGPPGGAGVRVEEYKRPKFQVTLEAPKTAPKLNEKVSMEGKAMAYTGAAIDGAKVRWRVVRQVRFPPWWYWCFWWREPISGSQEIAHGVTTTKQDGTFTIEFVARPDLSVSEKDEPIFVFSVSADVTDTAGETRSAQRTTQVGYTALAASMSAPDWLTAQKPVEITIRTTTLDGEGQKADCKLKIHALKQPEKVHRAKLGGDFVPMPIRRGRPIQPAAAKDKMQPPPDLSNPNSWELGDVVAEEGITTDAQGKATRTFQLKPGAYRAVLETQDRFGKKVTALLPIQVLDPDAKKFPIKIPSFTGGPKWTLEPGEEFMALWGTGYEKGRAFIEIEHRRKVIQAFWTELGATQQAVKQAVTEAMRGGFTVRITHVQENRAYLTQRQVNVPWSNKNLSLSWERFVSKLQPGQKETWTAVITGPDAKRAVAEMVAALYDQSLDAYLPHGWMGGFGVFRHDYSNLSSRFENVWKPLGHWYGGWPIDYKDTTMTYREFAPEIVANLWGYMFFGRGKGLGGVGRPGMMMEAAPAAAAPPGAPMMDGAPANRRMLAQNAVAERELGDRAAAGEDKQAGHLRKAAEPGEPQGTGGPGAAPGAGPDLAQVSARKNLNETAFFFPHLVSDQEGRVRIEFTMPEALTQWKFLGFAHDQQLRAGLLQDSAVTAKDLMVQPNPPRFLREGDVLEFTVKVTNQSATVQKGVVRLTLADARTEKSVDAQMGNTTTDQPFEIPAKESRSFSWRLSVPDGQGPIIYKAVGSTGRLSDGEEAMLPVLSRRVLVTESLPLPIRGAQTKKFQFKKLLESGRSDTLRSETLTVQMVSNPAWYAVMALPYLMEFPYECSEQVFNRLYANALARHIANSDPKIQRIFDQWKGTPALDSPLEKNQDLKAVILEETPWLRQAQAESQARRNVGILFDQNRLDSEITRTLQKLAEMQLSDGAWPWFPGGPPNDYITLYITTGFGRLRHLGVKNIDIGPAIKSLNRLDGWIDRIYRDILRWGHKDKNNLSPTIALYLYGRSFFLEDQKIQPQYKEAVDYFLDQARKYWLELANRQSQAHLAIALKRFGDAEKAQAIMRSIKERSVTDEELGMFWRDLELSWWWFRAPIETQAMMIEAFDEVMNDQKAVEECKVWLLKQKQTQDWKTTKATADAVYALLLRGENLLASEALVEVSLAGQVIQPEKVEAGTGFYEKRFVRAEIKPEMGEVVVKKTDPGVAWGSLHWQYLEDMTKVTAHTETPLKVEKRLYTKQLTKKGPVLEPVQGPVQVGDELVCRIVIRVDRDMEYVHLKDYRGSGTEPVNVLSQYKYRDGLGYYESTRDTASHFFIDYLPKGTYVFEYSVRVQHRGRYQTGFASIQCMYAPEFNSHSESLVLEVK